MRRTELLEKNHELLESNMHSELEPLKEHVNKSKGAMKVIAIIVPILSALAAAVYKLLI